MTDYRISNAIEVRIYLGHNKPNGGIICNAAIREFCEVSVDSRFEAYTIYEGEGIWMSEKEDATILEFITEAANYPSCVAIAKAYKTRFEQEAVLITHKSLESATLV